MTTADLTAEESSLILPKFDESTALALGSILLNFAKAENLPIVINIRTTNRTLFHAALPGSTPLNDDWARRKSASTLLFQKSSLLVGIELREKGADLAINGLSDADYAIHGGSFPIRVQGVGVVAAVTISGLPQLDDHALAVRGLRALI